MNTFPCSGKVCLVAVLLLQQVDAHAIAKRHVSSEEPELVEAYGNLPMSFEANHGQVDKSVQYLSRGPGYSLFLTGTEAVLSLRKPGDPANSAQKRDDPRRVAASLTAEPPGARASKAESIVGDDAPQSSPQSAHAATIRMELVGANPDAKAEGVDELPGKVNYLRGNDQSQWHANIETFKKVQFKEVYPGIDLVYYGNQQHLEYDFIVAPGARPETIALRFSGADSLDVNKHGDLVIQAGGAEIHMRTPVIYQLVGSERKVVAGGYVMQKSEVQDDARIAFMVASYDQAQPLIIDPVLVYSTYVGGGSVDGGRAIAVDAVGNAYVTGYTESDDFPTANALDSTNSGAGDVFVTKLSADGQTMLYSTYLGGGGVGGVDVARGIAVDAVGNAYVTGYTESDDFPTANALDSTKSGVRDVFVTKLSADGQTMLYSMYLGGSDSDIAEGIAVDGVGNAYVTGDTVSNDFPTVNALDSTKSGNQDGFVTKLSADGQTMLYSTYLGGEFSDYGNDIAVDGVGNAYVTGYTESDDFPTANALDSTNSGAGDVFVTKLSADGQTMLYSTYLGGAHLDGGQKIAVDAVGNAYVTGYTYSNDFPTANALESTKSGSDGSDGFVTKLSADGQTMLYSTYLGGRLYDFMHDIAVDGLDNAYVTGYTESDDFPTANALDSTKSGSHDGFVTKLSADGKTMLYSTYLGGIELDIAQGIAVDGVGNAYVTGVTVSNDFPTANALDSTKSGGGDGFIVKLGSDVPPPPPNAKAVIFFPGFMGSRLWSSDYAQEDAEDCGSWYGIRNGFEDCPSNSLDEEKLWVSASEAEICAMKPDANGNTYSPGKTYVVATRRHYDAAEYFDGEIEGGFDFRSVYGAEGDNGILDEKAGGKNVYLPLLQTLQELKNDGVLSEWHAIPYDWTKSLVDIVRFEPGNLNTGVLVQTAKWSTDEDREINTVKWSREHIDLLEFVRKTAEESGPVTLIGHSNGGLLAKLVARELPEQVEKVILIATPSLGTPKGITAALHGQMFTGIPGELIPELSLREVAENSLGAYNLLPSARLFPLLDAPVVRIAPPTPSTDPVYRSMFERYKDNDSYGDAVINSYETFVRFLTAAAGDRQESYAGSCSDLDRPRASDSTPNVLHNEFFTAYSAASLPPQISEERSVERFHNDFDAYDTSSWTGENTEVVQIVGWGLPTIKGARYSQLEWQGTPSPASNLVDAVLDPYCGDGTVLTASAAAHGARTWWVDLKSYNDQAMNIEHVDITSAEPVLNLIEAELRQQSPLESNFVSTANTKCPDGAALASDAYVPGSYVYKKISILSPVHVIASDASGRRTGLVPITNADGSTSLRILEEIPNSSYARLGGHDYLHLPVNEAHEISLTGYEIGNFSLILEQFDGNDKIDQVKFQHIPVTVGATARISVEEVSTTSSLQVDYDADGVPDIEIAPSEETGPSESFDALIAYIHTISAQPGIRNSLVVKLDAIETAVEAKNWKAANGASKAFVNFLLAQKGKQLSVDEANALGLMLNSIMAMLPK